MCFSYWVGSRGKATCQYSHRNVWVSVTVLYRSNLYTTTTTSLLCNGQVTTNLGEIIATEIVKIREGRAEECRLIRRVRESTFPIIGLQETPNHPICIGKPPSYILPQRLALLSCPCIPWSSKNTKKNTEKMSSTHVDDATHGTILSDSLRRLQLKEQVPSSLVEPSRRKDAEGNAEDQGDVLVFNSGPPSPGTLQRQALGHVYEGYGFRLTSGPATPTNPPPVGTSSPLPDPNGLGWPGKSLLCFSFLFTYNFGDTRQQSRHSHV